MAKADFEFYAIDGLEGEFVAPAIDSDPYEGAYEIAEIPAAALEASIRIVNRYAEIASVETVEAKPEEMSGYFFDTVLQGKESINQRVKIAVRLDEEDGNYSRAMNDIYSDFARNRHDIIPASRGFSIADEIAIYREDGGIEANLNLVDDSDLPMHPKVLARQFIPIRAFRWLPGPKRHSRVNGTLPPTFSPRPVSIAVAQILEVKGINPLVGEHDINGQTSKSA